MKIFVFFALSFAAFGQTAVFPGAVVTDAQLGVATNNIQTLLSGSINSTATSFQVVYATGMAANQIATIDSENVWICGVSGLTVSVGRSACPNVDGRGFDGSAAVSHSATGANCNFGTATGCVTEFVVGWHHNAPDKEIEAVEGKLHTELISAVDFGADPTGTADSTVAFNNAVIAALGAAACITVPPGTYRITGQITGPALGQLCIKGNGNAAPLTGTISGVPPRSTTLVQYQANARTISITGIGNVIDGLDLTIASGVTGVTPIYGTDTSTQPFSHNKIVNNTIHGYSSYPTLGALLAAGIDIESIGANSNNNTITGNKVELATAGYILHGASGSAVVNANIFDNNWAENNTHAALLTNAGEMGKFWLSMEGNGDAVTGVVVVSSNFYLDNGEQGFPHLMLSGGSHDNTLWGGSRGQIFAGSSGMTVTSDSTVNNEIDMGAFWFGLSPTVPVQRFACFACVGPAANSIGNLATFQLITDATGTRGPFRIADPQNTLVASNVSFSPNGVDATGNYYGYYFGTSRAGSFSASKPVSTTDLWSSGATSSTRVNHQFLISGVFAGMVGCSQYTAYGTTSATDCAFTVNGLNASTLVVPLIVGGDGTLAMNQVMTSASYLPACAAAKTAWNNVGVGAVVPNYPWATSATAGAAPGSGGAYNVSIRCDFDGTNYAWHIH